MLLVASAIFIVATSASPSYDAFGWLVWGRETLHWKLNTDGAPSWKPLTYLFTLPFALLGRVQLSLWVLTAVAAGLGAGAFAAHIVYRLTAPCPQRPWAPWLAAAIAAAGVLGLSGYVHLLLIGNSDPMLTMLCLAALDAHLHRRHRLAYVLLWLAALGRPEAWAFVFLYAVWAWRAVPAMRRLAVLGVVLVGVLWFSVPALTSKSALTTSSLAMNSAHAIHGNKAIGVIDRLRGLSGAPMQIAVLLALGLAAAVRDRVSLAIGAAAVLWVAIEVAFALHGYSAVGRYLIEPAALLVVLVAAGIGRVLAWNPRNGRGALRWAAPALVLVFLAASWSFAHATGQTVGAQVTRQRQNAVRVDRLSAVIAADGGPRAIRQCGQPVSTLGFQSTLAWELDMNVGNIGYMPGKSIRSGRPIVFFKPNGLGWEVRSDNPARATSARCSALRRDTAFA